MGIMGSGKSSVLSAICFALFGTFPELERRKLKLEDIIRLNENNAALALELSLNGDAYKVERKMTKEKRGIVSDATAYKNGQTVEKGAVAVTTYIEGMLQVDYDLFTRAIYSEQNNIDYFLTVDPKRRKEEMDVLLGLDRFETARVNAVSTINRLKSERKMHEDRFSKLELEGLRQRTKENEEKTVFLQVQIKKVLEDFKETERTLGEKEKLYNELNTKKQAYDNLMKQKIGLESVIENFKKESADVDENKLSNLKTEKNKGEEERNDLKNSIDAMDQQIFKINKEMSLVENKLVNSKRNKQEVAAAELEVARLLNGGKNEEIKNLVSVCEGKLVSYFSEKNSIENELKELMEINESVLNGSNCPLCGSAVDEQKIAHIKNERRQKTETKNKRLKELEDLVKETKQMFEKEGKKLKILDQVYEKIKLLKRNIEDVDSLEKTKKAVEEKILGLQKGKEEMQKVNESVMKRLQNIVVEISRLENLLMKKKQLVDSEEKLENVLVKIQSLTFDEKIYEQTRTMLETIKIKFQKISSEKVAQEKELVMLKNMKEVLTGEMERLEKMENEISKLLSLEEELIIYKNALMETQTSLRIDLVGAINAAMNEIWHIFYPYRDYKALRLNVTEKDYSFEISDGEWKTLESVASGGERACAALTLRVALSMVLTPNLSMLILDEPTHNLDKEAVELLSQTLQFKVPEVVEQTFVITHEEALMGSEFASSYKLNRDKEGFEATKVEKI